MKELIKWTLELQKTHPDKFVEACELVSLCQSEIEEGGSPVHEIELCKESIKQLIEEE
jgi:hypothetical protein